MLCWLNSIAVIPVHIDWALIIFKYVQSFDLHVSHAIIPQPSANSAQPQSKKLENVLNFLMYLAWVVV